MSDLLDELLDAASESLRNETAPGEESGGATRRAIFEGLRRRRRRRDWAMASAIAFCVLFVAPTVWAHVTGRLDALISVVMSPPPQAATEPSQSSRSPQRRERTEPELAAEPSESEEDPESEPEPAEALDTLEIPREVETAVPAPARIPRPRREPRREQTEAEESEGPVDVRERELFQRAHRSHFGGGTSPQTLRRWDEYLASYPEGRYLPEAQFNRALTLVRMGHFSRARRVLTRFAAGEYGGSRRRQAQELLELVEEELEAGESESSEL